MSTWGDLKVRVADDLNRSDLTTQIEKHLKQAIRHYERRRWWFNEQAWTLTTTAGVAGYAFSSISATDLLVLDTAHILIGNHFQELYEMDFRRFQNSYNDIVLQSQPQNYATFEDSIYLGATPNTTYTVALTGAIKLPELTDAQSNGWTTYGEDLIVARAEKTLYATVIQADPPILRGYQQLEHEALMSLEELHEGRTAPSNMKAHYL